jgi:hypothetical protein
MQRCWNCGEPGRPASKSYQDAWAGFWCDTCQVGWGIFGDTSSPAGIIYSPAVHAMSPMVRDARIGMMVMRPSDLVLLTGI